MSELTKAVRWIAFLCLTALMPVQADAQEIRPLRGNCTPTLLAADGDETDARGMTPRRLPAIRRDMWDLVPEKHSIVVLIEFNDQSFGMDDPNSYYDRLFNEHQYNERNGVGCVADYFRDQSAGRCDITFDIYGPIVVDESVKGGTYRASTFRNALLSLIADQPDDSAMGEGCDWDNDGNAQQVVFVYAGLGGNVDNDGAESGCIWPHTSTFTKATLPNGLNVSNYTVSAEMMTLKLRSGIGTICHEFSHSLGLPDLYPTSGDSEFSVVDEWDLMDGGNFSDNGWCPPNYSSLEKMLLGWITPTLLTDAESITGMLSVADGGQVWQVKKTDHEYYLLENRQWTGWDACLPGHGLAVFHVDYNLSAWSGNTVNVMPSHHRYDIIHADNQTYNDWDAVWAGKNPYVNHHSRYLSTSAYPYVVDGEVLNDELTDESAPAALVYAEDGLMSKPVTKIHEDDRGLISFDFMGGWLSTVERAPVAKRGEPVQAACDLLGRPARGGGIQIQNRRKQIRN